ncbi:MAG: hypothetical protein C4331_10540 [Meiothermus sp.]
MDNLNMYRLVGWFGLGAAVFWLSQFPLYIQKARLELPVGIQEGPNMIKPLTSPCGPRPPHSPPCL